MGPNVIAIPLPNLLRQKPLTQSVEALRTKKIHHVKIVVVDGANPPESKTPMRRSRDLKIYFVNCLKVFNWSQKMKNEIKD